LRQRKTQRALAGTVRRELAFECRDESRSRGIQRIVLFPTREPQERAFRNLVGRHLIADELDRSGNRFADDASDPSQDWTGVLGLSRDILVYRFEIGPGHRPPPSASAASLEVRQVRGQTLDLARFHDEHIAKTETKLGTVAFMCTDRPFCHYNVVFLNHSGYHNVRMPHKGFVPNFLVERRLAPRMRHA